MINQRANPPPNIQNGMKDHALVNGIRIKLTIAPIHNTFATTIFDLSLILFVDFML